MIRELQKKIAKVENQITTLETVDFRHFLRSNNDRLIFLSTFENQINSLTDDPNLQLFQMPVEPDLQYLTLWLAFHEPGAGLAKDNSGFAHSSRVEGSPVYTTGTQAALPAAVGNGVSDRIFVTDAPDINLTGVSTGFSIQVRVNPTGISLSSGKPRVIACKTDDDPNIRDLGWVIWVEPDGSVYFSVSRAGVAFTVGYLNAFPALNKWYNLAFTFTYSSNTPKAYLNGVISTEPVTHYRGQSTAPVTLNTFTKDMTLFGTDTENFSGMFSGALSDFRYWREKILSQSEINNVQTNGYSISDIPANKVAVVGVSSLPPVDNGGAPPPIPTPTVTTEADFTSDFTSDFLV